MALDVLHRVADLHGAGVGAQQIGGVGAAAFDIKGVVHRTRGVVGGRIQGGEVEPIGFDLGAIGHVKTHGAEDRFDALEREAHRVQATGRAFTTGQGHVQGFGLELGLQLGVSQSGAAFLQSGFNGLLGHVDSRALGFFLVHGQRGQALHELGDAPRFAQVLGFGVFQIRRCLGFLKSRARLADHVVECVHIDSMQCVQKKRGQNLTGNTHHESTPLRTGHTEQNKSARLSIADQAANLALTCSTMLLNAAWSWTAKSASILRSISIAAFFRPLANWL